MKRFITILFVLFTVVVSVHAQSNMTLKGAESVLQSALESKEGKSYMAGTVIIIDGHRVVGMTEYDRNVIKAAVKVIARAKAVKHITGNEFYTAYSEDIFKKLVRAGLLVRKI